jgi:hypothetical protein
MKRIRMVGLFALLVCALGAVTGVSTSSAAEYGVCVAQKKGLYENANCTRRAAKKGGFEWHAAGACYAQKKARFTEDECKTLAEKKGKPDNKGKFELAPTPTYTSKGGEQILESPGLGAVTCKSDTDVGAITGPKTDVDKIVLAGCETLGNKCKSVAPGEPATNEGEIITEPLSTELTESEFPAISGQFVVDTRFTDSAGASHFQAWFECGGVQFEITGFAAGVDSPINVMSSTITTTFAEANGSEQDLETTAFTPTQLGPFHAQQTGQSETVYSSPIETRPETPRFTPKWWSEGKLLTGSQPLAESTTVTAPFKLTLTQEKISEIGSIQCSEVKVKGGAIEAPSTRTESAVEYAGCKVYEPKPNSAVENTKCTVAGSHFVTNPLKGTLEGPHGAEKLKFVPQSGSELGLFEIEGASCSFKGLFHADGDMVCNYEEVETEKVEHPLEFTPSSGTEVTLSGPAQTEPKRGVTVSYKVHLSSGKPWSAF